MPDELFERWWWREEKKKGKHICRTGNSMSDKLARTDKSSSSNYSKNAYDSHAGIFSPY